jgi:AGZA family xanthine/uracil permease-like MFS transporter
VLVVVGAMMMAQISDIDFSKFEVALPAFLTIVIMPFTYSIANGIGMGFIACAVMYIVTGRARQLHWLMYVVAALFVVFFGIDPIMDAIG